MCTVTASAHSVRILSICDKGVFKGGGGSTPPPPPPRNFQIFLKSEGKEIEIKRKKRDVGGGGGLPLNIFSYFWG